MATSTGSVSMIVGRKAKLGMLGEESFADGDRITLVHDVVAMALSQTKCITGAARVRDTT